MSNADDLRRLAEEVKSAYEARVNFVSENKQGTANLLDTFDKDHEKMAKALRSELAEFKSELDASEKDRKSTDQAEVNQRRQDITNLLVEFDRAHEEMGDALRSELAGFKSELDASEKDRKSTDQAEVNQRRQDITNLLVEFDRAHEEMAKALRSELTRIKPELKSAESERKAGVHADMAAVQAEIKEMSSAWKELITTMQSVRGRTVITGKAKVVAGKVTKTVEEAIEEPVEEAIEEREQLRSKIIDIVADNPDGIKMTKIAEKLGIENWRSLIPVMRRFVDENELEKEGSLYFT